MKTIMTVLLAVSATLIVSALWKDIMAPPPLLLQCEAIDLEGHVSQKEFLPMINDKNKVVCPECLVKVFEIKDLLKHQQESAVRSDLTEDKEKINE